MCTEGGKLHIASGVKDISSRYNKQTVCWVKYFLIVWFRGSPRKKRLFGVSHVNIDSFLSYVIHTDPVAHSEFSVTK